MSLDTLYLLAAAALVFGAGAYAAKKILRRLELKQLVFLIPLALLAVGIMWWLLNAGNKNRGPVAPAPTTESTPLLRPDRD